MFNRKNLFNFFKRKKLPYKLRSPKKWHISHLSRLQNEWSKYLSSNELQTNNKSASVYYNQHYYSDSPQREDDNQPFSLNRLIKKTAAISVAGDRVGYFQDGRPFTDPSFFEDLQPGSDEGLSPEERIISQKKIITSNSTVFKTGGYPYDNPLKTINQPFRAGILSLIGSQFENAYLQYRSFFLDPYQKPLSIKQLDHLYIDSPREFHSAKKLLGDYDTNGDITRFYDGITYIARDKNGKFYSTPFKKNAIIFNSKAYINSLMEDVALTLIATDHMASLHHKPAYLKATAAGMGYFAKLNGNYDISHYLYPKFLRAFKGVLQKYSFPNIKYIEFPIYTETQQQAFISVFDGQSTINGVNIVFKQRDVLDFNEKEKKEYFLSVINPSDSNSLPGNEWGYGSVESAIGNNTTLRNDQVYLTNELILKKDRQLPVTLNNTSYTLVHDVNINEELTSPKP